MRLFSRIGSWETLFCLGVSANCAFERVTTRESSQGRSSVYWKQTAFYFTMSSITPQMYYVIKWQRYHVMRSLLISR